MALIELFGWLKHFREQRQRENLSQAELLKKELIMLGSAVLVIAILIGLVFVVIWIHEHNYVAPLPRQSRKRQTPCADSACVKIEASAILQGAATA